MSAAKHTPGPWTAEKREGDEWWFGGKDGAEIVINHPGAKYDAVCVIGARLSAEGQADADARLIAAAPELLDACLAMLAWDEAEKTAKPFDEDGGTGFYQRIAMCTEAFDKAREAIAKATGEAA